MSVPVRYILAALAFGVAALGFFLLPTDASACENGGCRPPPCHHNCNPPPPPPQPPCCRPPTVVVPPPNVPPPNIVVVNAGARAQAQASAVAIAIANVQTGDTIIRRGGGYIESGATASVTSSAFSVVEGSMQTSTVSRERELLIQAICIDASGNPHPASQTFGGRDVATTYRGEIYRCMSGTRMRYTVDGRSYDCEAGQALWYENGAVTCRTQAQRRPCNERSLLRRFGPGDKVVRIRDTETRETRTETTFNGAMTMDGGVGATVW